MGVGVIKTTCNSRGTTVVVIEHEVLKGIYCSRYGTGDMKRVDCRGYRSTVMKRVDCRSMEQAFKGWTVGAT